MVCNVHVTFAARVTAFPGARVLEPTGWGAMAFAQGFSAYLMLIVEYGFNLSATRETARALHAPERIPEVLAWVTGAKCVLGAVDSFADPNTSACSSCGQQAKHE